MTRTLVAVLGTLAEFHREPIPYDLPALIELVRKINPDLLCLDMTLEQWQKQDFSELPPEYAEALLPLAYQTDMVVAPIGDEYPMPRATAGGWRGMSIRWLRGWIGWLQHTAPGLDAVNQGWRHHLGDILYSLTHWLAGAKGRHAYHERIEHLTRSVLAVAQRNPGSRILVVANVQYCHHIRPRLRQFPDVQVAPYTEL